MRQLRVSHHREIPCHQKKWLPAILYSFAASFFNLFRFFMALIQSIHARYIYDSRGNPTVEVDLTTSEHNLFRAAVPSGASTGAHEALELRDEDAKVHFGKGAHLSFFFLILYPFHSNFLLECPSQGVLRAVENVNKIIAPALIKEKIDVTQQEVIDTFLINLDGTEDKSRLGANAILGVSLAVARAGAAQKGVPLYRHLADLAGHKEVTLPIPSFNVINGGSHAGNRLAMQEFMIHPTGASSFKEAMRIASEVYHTLKAVIKKKYGVDATNVGDEGGFAPNIQDNREGLDLLKTAIAQAGYTDKVMIGMDAAASEFFKDGKYDLDFKNPNSDPAKWLSGDQLADLYREFIRDYPSKFSLPPIPPRKMAC